MAALSLLQALPADARDPEDLAVLRLSDERGWRRCPECKAMVELSDGCNHISCVCGAHFCYDCGKGW
jgi:hypothetical protein